MIDLKKNSGRILSAFLLLFAQFCPYYSQINKRLVFTQTLWYKGFH